MACETSTRRQQELRLAAPPRGSYSLPPKGFWAAALLAIAAVFFLYAPSLEYHFILDDHRFTGDPRIQSPGHVAEYFTNYVWAQFTGGPPSFYRPLSVLWMRTNFIINEMSPWGWHFLSVVKHVAVGLLLYLLAWRLTRDRFAALVAAALFALHPAQTESVAWVTVPDPLMSIGVLATLLLYLKYAETLAEAAQSKKAKKKTRKEPLPVNTPSRSALPWLVTSAVVCFLTLLTKETAVILPVIVLLLTLVMLRADASAGTTQRKRGGYFGLLVARIAAALRLTAPFACAAALYFLLRLNAFSGKLVSLTPHLPWSTVVLSWPSILWFYAKVLFWPVRSYAYGDPNLAERFSLRGVFLPGLGVACLVGVLTVGLFWLWKKARRELPTAEAAGVEYALLIGTLLLVLPVLLTLNLNVLNPGDFLHGRYVYLSSIGLMLLVAAACRVAGKVRVRVLWVAGLVAIAFAVLALAQEPQWKDDVTLFTVGHELAPNNPWVALNLERAHVQAALLLVEHGRCGEVQPVFERVTREYPQEWSAWAGLGYCYFTLNNLPKAEESLRRAALLSKDPRTIQLWQELRAQMGLPAAPPPLD